MTTKRDRYLQIKHDLLSSCGQCIGFRARGVDLESNQEKPDCSTARDCHKSCPALGMGGAAPVKKAEAPAGMPAAGKDRPDQSGPETPKCHRCGKSSGAAMLPCRYKGQSLWVCTGCLPALIHG